jgi:general secretion pathway protein K
VLLVVLWVLTSAVVLISCFNAAVRSGAASAVSEVGQTKSEALLDAGLEIAAAHLLNNDENRRWRGDRTPHSITFADAELTIAITDAGGLVDLNKSDEKLLRALFQKFTRSMAKAARYTDVIMEARKAVSSDGNVKADSKVTDLSPEHRPALAFIDVWQFGRTPGIPREFFDKVAPFLTVYSSDGTIYPRTAPLQILEAIPNLNRADIEKIRYADNAALVDLMTKAPDFLTYAQGPAHLVTVRAQRTDDNYSISRTFVIATGIDAAAPYRVLARRPMSSQADR